MAQTTIYFASPTSEKRQLRDVRHDVHAGREGPDMLGQFGMNRFVIRPDTPLPIPDAVPDPSEAERAVRRAAAAEKAKELLELTTRGRLHHSF